MRRGRRRKIEVPTDSQPQFELGDTTEAIETRREKERLERRRQGKNRRGGRQRGQKERGWKGPSSWKRLRKGEKSDLAQTDTDVESTQPTQKKGQMKSNFLGDSDEKAIVEFIKQHKELYNKPRQI